MKKFLVVLSVFAVAAFMSGIASAQEKVPGIVVLKGAPLGGVKFDHAKHSKMEGVKCETCHHASKPEHASKVAHEPCQTCHTKVATLVWQVWQGSWATFDACSGFEAWWQVSHFTPSILLCFAWSNFTPPSGAPFSTTIPGTFSWADAMPDIKAATANTDRTTTVSY